MLSDQVKALSVLEERERAIVLKERESEREKERARERLCLADQVKALSVLEEREPKLETLNPKP